MQCKLLTTVFWGTDNLSHSINPVLCKSSCSEKPCLEYGLCLSTHCVWIRKVSLHEADGQSNHPCNSSFFTLLRLAILVNLHNYYVHTILSRERTKGFLIINRYTLFTKWFIITFFYSKYLRRLMIIYSFGNCEVAWLLCNQFNYLRWVRVKNTLM